jgi:hypothetical protein
MIVTTFAGNEKDSEADLSAAQFTERRIVRTDNEIRIVARKKRQM